MLTLSHYIFEIRRSSPARALHCRHTRVCYKDYRCVTRLNHFSPRSSLLYNTDPVELKSRRKPVALIATHLTGCTWCIWTNCTPSYPSTTHPSHHTHITNTYLTHRHRLILSNGLIHFRHKTKFSPNRQQDKIYSQVPTAIMHWVLRNASSFTVPHYKYNGPHHVHAPDNFKQWRT